MAEASLSSVSAEASLGTVVEPKDEASVARAVEPTPIAVSVAEGPVARDVAIAYVGAPEMRCIATLASSVVGELSHTAEALAPVQQATPKAAPCKPAQEQDS